MKLFCKNPIAALLVVFVVLIGISLIGTGVAQAATAPTLGALSTFGVVSDTFTNSNTPPQTIINGNVCYTTGPASAPVTVNGTYGVGCPGTSLADQNAALAILNGQACTPITGTLNAVIIGANAPGTFPPGCYAVTGAMDITTGTTVTLDATAPGGDGGNVWIFKSTLGFTTGASTAGNPNVVLANGAMANNVFWAPVGGTTIGANFALSATPTFVGNIFRGTAAGLSITLGHFTNLLGRTLAFDSTVTTDANTITAPTTLTLEKVVTNDNGGTALASAWTLSTIGLSPTLISGATGSVAVTGAAVVPGAYTLSESGGSAGYLPSTYSCVLNGGVPVPGNTITLAAGDAATCTITNDDIAPRLHLIKVIVGGSAALAAFPLTASGTGANDITGTSPVNSGAGLLADSWALTEINVANYTASAWVCVGGVQVGSNITLGINDEATCTITNTYVAPGGGGGYGAVPPIISIVKVPSPLALPGGPGSVLYTYTVNNIGTVAMDTVTVVDDTCSPLALVSGDTNSDSRLDLTETWIYTCTTTLTATHTNTVVATGWANGISTTDLANATVIVGLPIVPPLIHITKVPSPLTLPATGGMVTYTKTVTNPGTVPLSYVSVTDAKCGPVNYISGDTNSDSLLDPTETWIYRCSMNLTQTTTNTAIATGEANGLTATDFALATVVVPGVVPVPAPVPALPNTGFPPQSNSGIMVLAGLFIAASISLYIYRKKLTN